MIQKNSHLAAPIAAVLCDDEIKQLTAEIYAMKLLEISQYEKDEYVKKYIEDGGEWFSAKTLKLIGSTQQLHDHLVEQFNKEVK